VKGRVFQRTRQKEKGVGWSYTVDLPRDSGGRRQQITGTCRTRKEAEAAVVRAISEGKALLRAEDPANMTLSTFLKEWLDGAATRLAGTTMERYTQIAHST